MMCAYALERRDGCDEGQDAGHQLTVNCVRTSADATLRTSGDLCRRRIRMNSDDRARHCPPGRTGRRHRRNRQRTALCALCAARRAGAARRTTACPSVVSAASSDRAAPLCRHFGICGGCVAQHMSDRLYADWKRSIVVDAFRQHGLQPEIAPLRRIAPGRGGARCSLRARKREAPSRSAITAARATILSTSKSARSWSPPSLPG